VTYPFSERPEILPFVPASARAVLDVGCGPGGFGAALRREDPSRLIWAVEEDGQAAAAAEPHYDRVVVGTFPMALCGEGARFDCVVFNDVLEHMVDPWATLRSTVPMLAPGGVVVASIPNVRNVRVVIDLVVRGDWTYTDLGILDRTHLRFFTSRTIRSLFEDCGFVVDALRGINALGHLRFPRRNVLPLLLKEFAYTGFAIRARPRGGRGAEGVARPAATVPE
jgi:2-polyprenyl-3-methyl-5-hydroxy-6-metoxy-1,4-benzoquinol methylase